MLIRLSCVLGLVACGWVGDEPGPAAGDSPVGRVLAEVRAASDRALAESSKVYESIAAGGNLASPEVEARRSAARERFIATVRPELHRLLAIAEQNPGDPAGIAALDLVARDARGWDTDEANRALRLLIRDHARREGISQATRIAFAYEERPEADQLCRLVLADNPSRIERGRVCLDLAYSLLYHSRRVRNVRAGTSSHPLPPCLIAADPDALRTEAESLYERCVRDFADVPVVGYGTGKTVGDFARGALTDLRELIVGRPVPEIVGEDIAGQPLRLSDYRGRVVVLVFAGEWCGPCRGQAQKYHEILRPEAQGQNPCVVLEVNTDATREPVQKAIAAGEIAWPCWFDGGVTGPITMAWGVESFPTVHVIDGAGVLRARDVRGEGIAAAVAQAHQPGATRPAHTPPAGQP